MCAAFYLINGNRRQQKRSKKSSESRVRDHFHLERPFGPLCDGVTWAETLVLLFDIVAKPDAMQPQSCPGILTVNVQCTGQYLRQCLSCPI